MMLSILRLPAYQHIMDAIKTEPDSGATTFLMKGFEFVSIKQEQDPLKETEGEVQKELWDITSIKEEVRDEITTEHGVTLNSESHLSGFKENFDGGWSSSGHLSMHIERQESCIIDNTMSDERDSSNSISEQTASTAVRKHNPTNMKCNKCGKEFSLETEFKYHICTHLGGRIQYKCEVCNKVFSCISDFSNHSRFHPAQEKKHLCEICNKIFSHRSSYLRHFRTHSAEKKKHLCEICNKIFSYRSSYLRHFRTHCGTDSVTWDMSYRDTKSLNIQADVSGAGNSPSRLSKCVESQQKCVSYDNVSDEPDSSDSTSEKTNSSGVLELRTSVMNCYKCETCGKEFSAEMDQNHICLHLGERRQYKCEVCDEIFFQETDLSIHSHIHSVDKQYICDICKKVFSYRHLLAVHLHTHTRERFSCEVCNKFFSHRSSFARHQHTHTGNKPYKCDMCNREFYRHTHLVNHHRAHVNGTLRCRTNNENNFVT